MKRLITGFITIILVICVSGCVQPIGNIDKYGGNGKGDVGSGEFNFMWLVPTRLLYETEQSFDKYNDMQILVAEDGLVKEVKASDPSIAVEILYYSQLDGDPDPIPVTNQYFEFTFPGRYTVKVTHDGEPPKSAQYSVTVQGQYVEGGDGSNFFDMIWL